MKAQKAVLFFLLFILHLALWAQNLPRQVIATAGNISQSGNVSLSWTVGQPGPVETASPSGFYLSQGFQQGDEWWVSINEAVVDYNNIIVYPNPSKGQVHLLGTLPSGGTFSCRLLDNSGKTVYNQQFNAQSNGEVDTEINFQGLSNGTYFLQLSGGAPKAKYSCVKKISILY
jgi:hypothetical protein